MINFTLKDLTIAIETIDTIGNLLQEWLKAWLYKMEIEFEEKAKPGTNTRQPDIPMSIGFSTSSKTTKNTQE